MKKKTLIVIIIAISILTTGCWDMVEINERLFPYSIGVDLNDGDGERYIVSISYLNINAIGKNAIQEERVFIVSTTASSIFEATRQLSTILPYPFHLKHLRVLVLGEDLAKDGHLVRQIMDGLSRDYIINKKIQIAVGEGKAQEILQAVPRSARQEEIEGSLFSMLRGDKTTSRYTPKSLTDFIQTTDKSGIAIVPRAAVYEDDIKIFGGAIFRNYCLIGNLGEIENRSIALMRDKVKTELIDAPYKDTTLSYTITGQSTKKKLIKNDGKLSIKLDIETEGSLQEYIIMDDPPINSERIRKEMEDAIDIVLNKEIMDTLEILQKKYKADAIDIGEYISKFHPKVWKEVSENWDEVFSEMEIDAIVSSKIRRRGLVQ